MTTMDAETDEELGSFEPAIDAQGEAYIEAMRVSSGDPVEQQFEAEPSEPIVDRIGERASEERAAPIVADDVGVDRRRRR